MAEGCRLGGRESIAAVVVVVAAAGMRMTGRERGYFEGGSQSFMVTANEAVPLHCWRCFMV